MCCANRANAELVLGKRGCTLESQKSQGKMPQNCVVLYWCIVVAQRLLPWGRWLRIRSEAELERIRWGWVPSLTLSPTLDFGQSGSGRICHCWVKQQTTGALEIQLGPYEITRTTARAFRGRAYLRRDIMCFDGIVDTAELLITLLLTYWIAPSTHPNRYISGDVPLLRVCYCIKGDDL
jgi:hypothetical protein